MYEFFKMVRRQSLIPYSNNRVLGETGSGETTQYGIDPSRFLIRRWSTFQGICNFVVHSNSSCCSHVCCQTSSCGRRNRWCVHDVFFQPLCNLSCFFAVSLWKEVGYIRFGSRIWQILALHSSSIWLMESSFERWDFFHVLVPNLCCLSSQSLWATQFCNAIRQSSLMKHMSELSMGLLKSVINNRSDQVYRHFSNTWHAQVPDLFWSWLRYRRLCRGGRTNCLMIHHSEDPGDILLILEDACEKIKLEPDILL